LNEKAFDGKEPALDLSTAPKKIALKATTIGARCDLGKLARG
jgi:hypothetical protein